jgi:hypothetical protein
VHAIVRVHVPTLFSMRQLTANSMAARALVCPTPAALKMAMLSSLIWRDGEAAADDHLAWLAPLGVAFRPPPRAGLSAFTVRVHKSERPDELRTPTVGLREYVSFSQPFGLALLDVPDARRDDASHGLTHLSALGTRDSLVQILQPPEWVDTLPPGFAVLTAESDGPGEVTAVLDDLGPTPSFARLNAYRQPGRATLPRLGEDRRRTIVTLPLRWRRRGADGAELEAL